MRSYYVVWVIFIGLLVAAALFYRLSDPENVPDEGGGSCACMGFGMLLLLLLGTFIERLTTKRRGRGFDVLPLHPPEGPDGPDGKP